MTDEVIRHIVNISVVDPGTKSVTVYKNDRDITALDIDDVLADAQLLPGFHAAIKDIFE